jgi:hypothetical protein
LSERLSRFVAVSDDGDGSIMAISAAASTSEDGSRPRSTISFSTDLKILRSERLVCRRFDDDEDSPTCMEDGSDVTLSICICDWNTLFVLSFEFNMRSLFEREWIGSADVITGAVINAIAITVIKHKTEQFVGKIRNEIIEFLCEEDAEEEELESLLIFDFESMIDVEAFEHDGDGLFFIIEKKCLFVLNTHCKK